tara:strand:+ start:223 stop:1239 length:1017 start_codon:yes stop_codon:yes gene_type:complete
MAYQKTGTPRFYIDIFSYLNSIGQQYGEGYNKELFTLEPNNQKLFTANSNNEAINIELGHKIKDILNSSNLYLGFLNHSFAKADIFQLVNFDFDLNSVLNSESQGKSTSINENGCSIITMDYEGSTTTSLRFNLYSVNDNGTEIPVNLGCISFGSYYDMPHSPELDITMEIEFDGFDTVKTLGGATMTNVRYAGSPWWYDVDANKVEPWAVGDSTAITKRNGRRTWSMKFSYLDQKNLLSSNYMSNHYMENNSGYDSDDLGTNENDEQQFYFNIDNDDSFVSQVLNKVGNGQRFIFQPDNTANNPSDFAIAMLDQDSLQIKQVANGVYDISLKITEVW